MSEEPHESPETPPPDESDVPDPAPRPALPESEEATPVESLMGLRDFLAVAPRRRSAASTQAANAALQHWMRRNGHDTNGFYSMAEWQGYYAEAMSSTGD